MKLYMTLLSILIAATAYAADDKEPAELTALRNSYTVEVVKVLKPVNDRYVESLTQLKKKLGGAGDIAGAVAVDTELKTVTDSITVEKTVSVLNSSVSKWKTVLVKALDADGSFVGKVKKGQIVVVSYVSGKWTDDARGRDEFLPDVNKGGGRCALYLSDGRFIPVEGDTKNKPFEWMADADLSVSLRIYEQGSTEHRTFEDNAGNANYKVMTK